MRYPNVPQGLTAGAAAYKWFGSAAGIKSAKQHFGLSWTDRISIDRDEIEHIRPERAT